MKPTAQQLKRWRELAEKATSGPWNSLSLSGDPIESVWTDEMALATHDMNSPSFSFHAPQAREDAAFIAAARMAVPALLDEVEALRALLRRARKRFGPFVWSELAKDIDAALSDGDGGER